MSIGSSLGAAGSGILGGALSAVNVARINQQWGLFQKKSGGKSLTQSITDKVTNFVTQSKNEGGDAYEAVLVGTHVQSISIKKSSVISTAPQEDGAFLAYDKIQNPYSSTIRFLCDGSTGGNIFMSLLPSFLQDLGNGLDFDKNLKARSKVASKLDDLVKDTNLYFIKTPERSYQRANVIGYDISRGVKEGLQILIIDLHVQEVRNAVSSGWVNAKNPQGAQAQNNGQVQPKSS